MESAWRNLSSLMMVLIYLLLLRSSRSILSFAEKFASPFSCTEEVPFFMSQLPLDCGKFMMCAGGAMTFHLCPPGMVFNQRSLQCDWPTPYDVRRCYRSVEGYARATCRRQKFLRVPSPDSCALFLDCNQEADATEGHVLECPYPSLFSPLTYRCADFRQVQHLCRPRPVPKAPCDYLQYRQLTSSSNACHRRHPSCVGMHNGFHPVAMRPQGQLYAKRCFLERTVDIVSCTVSTSTSLLWSRNKTCTRHLYDV